MPQLPKPAMPHINGSTTPCTKAQAIAASTALPPAFRISAPASVASGWAATIIARLRYRMGSPVLACSIHERGFRVLCAPSPCPLPLRGRGDRNDSLDEGEGRGEGDACGH